MCGQCLLAVARTLHRAQDVFKVPPNVPNAKSLMFSQSHFFKNEKACRNMMLLNLQESGQS